MYDPRLLTVILLALLGTAVGCRRETVASGLHGVAVANPRAKPSFVLTTTDGQPFDFARETDGRVALLFFGYTHCPDVCPLHMANIAAVLKQMPWEERSQIRVVFVTTDPARDTPERLASWLRTFDASFIGLSGTEEAIAAAQQSLGLRVAQKEPGPDTAYTVGHAAQVFAFARDGMGYLVYPFGTRQEDWASDLPQLARDSSGESIRRQLAASINTRRAEGERAGVPNTNVGGFVVTRAVVAAPAAQSEASAYLSVKNDTPVEDILLIVAAELAARVEIHGTSGAGAMRKMAAINRVPIPPHADTHFAPGGRHLMLFDLRRAIALGDTITLYLSFARAGAVEVRAPVVRYADLDSIFRSPP